MAAWVDIERLNFDKVSNNLVFPLVQKILSRDGMWNRMIK